MAQSNNKLHGNISYNSPFFCNFIITIPTNLVDALYQEASLIQKNKTKTYGFEQGKTPLGYIEHNFRSNLTEHVKEFLFKYFVLSFLHQEIYNNKIVVAGEPRIEEIIVKQHEPAIFNFGLSLIPPVELQDWKDFVFKAPKRKNYKDIDRQVDAFLKDESQRTKQNNIDTIQINDWVCFTIYPLNNQQHPLFDYPKENLWLRIGDEEADLSFQAEFINRKIGETFESSSSCFQEYFSDQLDTQYTFFIEIKDILPNLYFDIEQFKHHFRLKTSKEVHAKLIEVFSFRNDISQRRSTVEDALNLLISKHHVTIPNYIILRQQKMVLDTMQHNPDYFVYKNQHDFNENVRQLAEKQTRETMLIDYVCYADNINVDHHDIKSYLNLTKRARTKEFLYFNPPCSKIKGQEIPLPIELLRRCCLREKTLNQIIYYLTRK